MAQSADRLSEIIECTLCEHSIVMNKIQCRGCGRNERKSMGYKDLKFDKDSVFLVTGGAGFIGSNLCEAILNLGYKVRCLDDLSTGNPKHVEMFEGNPNYTFIPHISPLQRDHSFYPGIAKLYSHYEPTRRK